MQQQVCNMPHRTMAQLHRVVSLNSIIDAAKLAGQLHRAGASPAGHLQQHSACICYATQHQSVQHTTNSSAAAKYAAAARSIAAAKQLNRAIEQTQPGPADSAAVLQLSPLDSNIKAQQGSATVQKKEHSGSGAADSASAVLTHLLQHSRDSQQVMANKRSRKQSSGSRVTQQSAFLDRCSLCDMLARSDSMIDWQEAARGIQHLVKLVNSPAQAQQVWQVAVTLAAHPIPRESAQILGGAVVALAKVTLTNHDYSIFQQLLQHNKRFHFSKGHVDQLFRSAVAAEVGLEDLQTLLDTLPKDSLTSRCFYALIKSFMERQQYAEAAHCFNRLEVAGLELTNPLESLLLQLRAARSGPATRQAARG